MPKPHAEGEHSERETIKALEKDIAESLMIWSENLKLLDEKIPHNDILVENKTLSYHVFRNQILGHIDELTRMEEVLHDHDPDARV